MKKIATFALMGMLLVGTVACSGDKTSSNAPNADGTGALPKTGTAEGNKTAPNAASPGASPTTGTVKSNKDDATSEIRRKQLESDIRAREQRTGGDTNRADSDLSSEVRSKLEANIPKSSLTVTAKNGALVVSGTVPAQNQLAKIEPLAKQIKGVKSVKVAAKVAPASN